MEREQKNGFSIVGIIIIIAAVAVLGGGFLYWSGMLNRLFPEETFIPYVEPRDFQEEQKRLHQIEQIDTSTWKTYRNEQYGFEVRYPLSWAAIESKSPGLPYLAFISFGKEESIQSGGVIAITVRSQSIDQYIESLRRNGIEFVQEDKTNLGGFPATRAQLHRERYTDQEIVIIVKNSYLYEVNVSPASIHKDTFNQILFTFKFIK